MVGIAASQAGAAKVTAADVDPWSQTAVRLNAAANSVSLDFTEADLIGQNVDADVVLAGDVFYDKSFAGTLVPWFETLAAEGKDVLVGHPGRAYLPKDRLEFCAVYEVPVTRALEDSEVKKTTVLRFRALGLMTQTLAS